MGRKVEPRESTCCKCRGRHGSNKIEEALQNLVTLASKNMFYQRTEEEVEVTPSRGGGRAVTAMYNKASAWREA